MAESASSPPGVVPTPAAEPAVDEWRARDGFERDLLRQVRRTDWRAGKEKLGVIKWNGVFVRVLITEQV